MLLTLVTPEKKFVTDLEVEEVIVPAYRGELGILPGHAPLVTTLNPGILRYRAKGSTTYEKAALSWGYCEVSPNSVMILADTAETPDQVDKERAMAALKNAEEKLKSHLPMDQVEKYQRKAARARIRLGLVNNNK